MFGSVTSPTRQRVNKSQVVHSLARRACILKGSSEHGAVQLRISFAILLDPCDSLRIPENIVRL
jgi:hypothetical protein